MIIQDKSLREAALCGAFLANYWFPQLFLSKDDMALCLWKSRGTLHNYRSSSSTGDRIVTSIWIAGSSGYKLES